MNSSVFKWPDQLQVDRAVRDWAEKEMGSHEGVLRIGYFGSYARGDWGVGSDLDLVVIVDRAIEPFERRSLTWDLSPLPVPADLLVYTSREWLSLREQGGRFARTLEQETVWVYEASPRKPEA
ncbi:MAG: nucleotidyltransferase domain-containing protein [Desulfomonilaceae bacterium]